MNQTYNEFLRKKFPDIFDDDMKTKAIRIIQVLGDLKTEIYERQLEGEFKDKSEAIEFAKIRL